MSPPKLEQPLDTRSISYTNEFNILENLTSRLVMLDEVGTYQMSLASNIQKITNRSYRLKIKKAFFSNGELIKLVDVKETLERLSLYGSSNTSFQGAISSIVVNEDELSILLSRDMKSFLYYLSLPDFGILHSSQYNKVHIMSEDFVKVSSGPFRYQVDSNEYKFVKNKFYTLESNSFPETVELVNSFGKDASKDILKNKIDLGQVSYLSFFENQKEFLSKSNLKYFGVPSDALTYVFFTKKATTKYSVPVRRWIRKILQNQITIDAELKAFAKKSIEYFPPESPAFINIPIREEEVSQPVNAPKEIVIHTYTTSYNVTIESLVKRLEKITEMKVTVLADIKPLEVNDKLNSGQVDLFLTIKATDFRMPIESISFEYFSPNARLVDMTGKIKSYLNEYETSNDPKTDSILLKKISKQMLDDAQIIPLFHSAIPFFYNSDKVDISGLGHLFILNAWKLRAI